MSLIFWSPHSLVKTLKPHLDIWTPVRLHHPISINKHILELWSFWQFQLKLSNYNLVIVEFMAELLCCVALDCACVPNEVASQCLYCHIIESSVSTWSAVCIPEVYVTIHATCSTALAETDWSVSSLRCWKANDALLSGSHIYIIATDQL